MRSLSLILFISATLLYSCNSRKKDTKIVSEDGKTEVTMDRNAMNNATAGDAMQQKMEELKNLTPLTLEQLKAMLPEELAGMKRTNYSANSAMGFALAEGRYKNEGEDKELKLVIWDCAGEAGAGFYTMTYWTQFNMQSESDDGYTKSVDFNGGKAIEKFSKSSNEYELTYTTSERLLVNLQGRNLPLDVLKQAATSLNLKTK